jgi:tRNA pseudouridine38-40 synthase
MAVVKLTFEYDGTDFAGWAAQPEQRTVEGELRIALDQVFPGWTGLGVAGRTDAGVHALAQVASFTGSAGPPLNRAPVALNAALPDDVAVIAAEEMDEDFHGRAPSTRTGSPSAPPHSWASTTFARSRRPRRSTRSSCA